MDEQRAGYPRHPSLVVAIDGPSGSGKSTVSRAVARRLPARYLDTGSMYRALTAQALAEGIPPTDADALADLAALRPLTVGDDPDEPWVAVDGRRLDDVIRGPAVTRAVSAVSAVPAVRARLIALQRRVIAATPAAIVVEGRDIGTVVAPDAPVKIFLTASGEERASRRFRQVAHGDVATVRADIDRRDRLDSVRTVGPLVRAADAVELDTTALSVGEVVDAVLRLCEAARAARVPQ